MHRSIRLIDSLGCELLGVVQAGVPAPVAFCVIASPAPRVVAGWIADAGGVAVMPERALAVVRAVAPDDGVCECRFELIDGCDRVVLASFAVQSMHVCVGVAWPGADPAFDASAVDRLCAVAAVAAQLGQLRAQCFEHERRELVLRSLRSLPDGCCVIDLEHRQILWTYDLRDEQPCARDICGDEASFIDLVEGFHRAASTDAQLPYAPVIGRTAVVRTIDLFRPAEFDGARCLAVALSYFEGESTRLSARERQIAQLLASGYSTVNAAAILSLSENTIRTYVRRLYRKLEITNRADLTRKCTELSLGML